MRKLISGLLFSMVISFSGCSAVCSLCLPEEAKTTAKENAALCDSFIQFMDAGQTTRELEQRFIQANRRAWHAQNYALNDEPLPRDVDVWLKRRQLGVENGEGSATIPRAPATPARRP